MLPKGTLVPNSGNISSTMTRAQIIQTQNKYCGKSGVVYVTGSTGPTGPFSGDVLVVTDSVRTPIIYATTSGITMTIGSNLTSGSLAIGGKQTGNIFLGAFQTTGVLNIGTGLRTLDGNGGGINIGTGSSVVNPIIIGGVNSALTLGGASSNTTVGNRLTVNGNITIGATGTIFTTLGQQIRLGYAHTQAVGTTSSSFGPFFKSFGPATVTGTTYDILYEGVNGLFTPSGLDGVGGLLTIVIKSTSSKMATLTYNVMKRNGVNSLTIISNVFGGWTTNPTISSSPIAGQTNNIRITFNSSDSANSTVSWLFMGA